MVMLLNSFNSSGKCQGMLPFAPMTRFLAQQLGGSHDYSVAKAQRDFGYTPIVPVAEGMRRLEPELRRLAAGPPHG